MCLQKGTDGVQYGQVVHGGQDLRGHATRVTGLFPAPHARRSTTRATEKVEGVSRRRQAATRLGGETHAACLDSW